MTNPCIDPEFFEVTDGAVSPLRHWQFAHRATAQAGGANPTVVANPGGTTLFTTNLTWTNNTPIAQRAYVLMTQGPVRYSIDNLKHLQVRYQWGLSSGVAPADPALTEESRVRGYGDLGTGTVSGQTVGVFYLMEDRHPTHSVPIGDLVALAPGEAIRAKVQVSWSTLAWGLDWASIYGDPAPLRLLKIGPVRLDVFTTPAFT
ncbi:hypothetical protein SAMN05421776_108204 [Nocardia farcinica]|uniref:DUF7172 domain-containing protein n=1 Tax=Nocardia farcinica TaxID=37329 RepID=A0A0H5NU65_NOCFR|nr:hypothetical protein [Nocardia farcinica]AXK88813.1 hypothetical protein DXT66_27155 [Nocardia farcinica]PFX04072.1 hypothetical protein CJ469_01946 [Nocardia farcinica]PFX10230.1 hypothetical protein CJ468_01077 [Nocardia farcinica]CRY73556.1 Uncharacterised protein [Nocardia farcinica]SIT29601.1 hypothetical protein SAMN05421776_108204 [Nocardia farcinica]